MKLRIFIGLAPLFILLVAMGANAVWLFAKLGMERRTQAAAYAARVFGERS